MILTDYDEEKTMEMFKREFREDGYSEGLQAGYDKGARDGEQRGYNKGEQNGRTFDNIFNTSFDIFHTRLLRSATDFDCHSILVVLYHACKYRFKLLQIVLFMYLVCTEYLF